MRIINNAPTNSKILNNAPTNKRVLDPNPSNSKIIDQNFVYMDNFTILAGQPVPFGLNWAITYPTTLNFQAVRK